MGIYESPILGISVMQTNEDDELHPVPGMEAVGKEWKEKACTMIIPWILKKTPWNIKNENNEFEILTMHEISTTYSADSRTEIIWRINTQYALKELGLTDAKK